MASAVLLNKSRSDYVSKKTGNPVKGFSLTFLVERRQKSQGSEGEEVINIWEPDTDDTSVRDMMAAAHPGDLFELFYFSDRWNNHHIDKIIPISVGFMNLSFNI